MSFIGGFSPTSSMLKKGGHDNYYGYEDIPVPDIARTAERKERRGADVEHLVSVDEGSGASSLGSPSVAAATAAEVLQRRNSRRLSSGRPLGPVEFQSLQIGELSAALLCSPNLHHPASMASSTTSGGGVPSGQLIQEMVKIKASGRTFRTSSTHMRDLMKRKALTLPQTVRYDEKGDQFFVDCSAEVFEEVFDFFRTGDLHLPKKVCIEKSLREMRRLNVFPNMLAPCCFARYDRFRAQKEAMKIWYEQLVKDPADGDSTSGFSSVDHPAKKMPIRMQVWNFLENPFSSKFATTYSWITIIMVALSISGFIIETLPQIDILLNNYKFVKNFGDLINLCDRLANPPLAMALNGTNSTNSSDSGPLLEMATDAPTAAPCPVAYDKASSSNNKGIFTADVSPTATECYIASTLWFVDYFAAAFFTLDLLVRFFVSPNKLQFFKSRLNLVDALALVPFYVELVFSVLTRMAYNQGPTWRRSFQMWEVLEVFRSLRLLRIFRLAKWNYGLNVLYYTARAIVGPMSTLLTICIIGILFFGTVMYYVDARDRFTSIPISIYWAAITMTTVGYGDITPKSGQGCFIAALCASCGILVIGFVLPIVTSKFMFYYQHIKMGRYYKKMVRRSTASSSSMSSLDTTSAAKLPTSRRVTGQGQSQGGETDSLLAVQPPPMISMTTTTTNMTPNTAAAPVSYTNSSSGVRKSTDESTRTAPPDGHSMPLIAESNLSVDIDEEDQSTPKFTRTPFLPADDGADDSDYRHWNGKIDSVH